MRVKAVCIALALIFGASLIATGVMADAGCGPKCCCLSKPVTQHHAPQEQLRSVKGCCAGSSQMPCDLETAVELQFPEIILAASAGHTPTAAGPTGNFPDGLIDRHDFRSHAADHLAREQFRSPPLYLQNLSFII